MLSSLGGHIGTIGLQVPVHYSESEKARRPILAAHRRPNGQRLSARRAASVGPARVFRRARRVQRGERPWTPRNLLSPKPDRMLLTRHTLLTTRSRRRVHSPLL